MISPPSHRARCSFRRFSAVILTTVYILIVMSPLASFAMLSKTVVHAVTGECSGDCDICGCSLESRANHTCCCAKKKQMQARDANLSTRENCSLKPSNVPATPKGACCAASRPAEPAVAKNDCCATNGQHQHDGDAQGVRHTEDRSRNETVFKCGCPCGTGKLLALAGAGTSEWLPYKFSEKIGHPHEVTNYSHLSQRMASRYADPPDPPPRLPLHS
jgi:hypothetical protein